jgi:hypothetical protein
MYQRIFKYNPSKMKGKLLYQQLECLDCLKLTNKMLSDEIESFHKHERIQPKKV